MSAAAPGSGSPFAKRFLLIVQSPYDGTLTPLTLAGLFRGCNR